VPAQPLLKRINLFILHSIELPLHARMPACAHEFKTANMKSIYLYLTGLLFMNYTYSQTDSASKQYSDKSVFSANIVYQSLAHFL
ncbi:hypothetical protein, partial [Escherichia coli]|uniref:hypothetical protein n=1 Tax=Escherichia coli TaxID=562 RepID=UPI003CE590CB